MKIVVKETLQVFDASELPKPGSGYSHIQFDFGDLVGAAEALDSVGLAILQMPDEPMYDSRYQRVTVGAVIENDGVYSSAWVPEYIELTPDQRRDLIADKRWVEETKPIEYAGRQFHADRDSRVMLLSMSIDAKLDPEYNEPEFKTMDGFVLLSNADILAVGEIVKAQVRSAYARESYLLDLIEQGDPITPNDWT